MHASPDTARRSPAAFFEGPMEPRLTVEELELRWETTLQASRRAVAAHPAAYRRLKALAADILAHPVDINDYFPIVETMMAYLKQLDPCSQGSIYDLFCARISPETIWQVRELRMECKDLLVHLDAFDQWRREQSALRMVK